jgi:hypothetical protein
MKGANRFRKELYGPLQRKTFRAALNRELREHIPTLGVLTAEPLAKRIEQLVEEYFPPRERLRMGQVLWLAVDEAETAGYGKRIEQTKMKPVTLDVVTEEDIRDYLAGTPGNEIKKKAALRLFEQAKEQGGVLTNVDVASILHLNPLTIGVYVRAHERKTDTLIPRRGTVHDIGPSVTHKRKICRQVILEGRSIEEVARDTHHSPEAVTRYIRDYRRVAACLNMGLSMHQTSFATRLPKRLVSQYKDIMAQHSKNDQRDVLY